MRLNELLILREVESELTSSNIVFTLPWVDVFLQNKFSLILSCPNIVEVVGDIFFHNGLIIVFYLLDDFGDFDRGGSHKALK